MSGIHIKKMKEATLIKEVPIWHTHKRWAKKVCMHSPDKEGPQACCRHPMSSLGMDLHLLPQMCFLFYKIPICTQNPNCSSTHLILKFTSLKPNNQNAYRRKMEDTFYLCKAGWPQPAEQDHLETKNLPTLEPPTPNQDSHCTQPTHHIFGQHSVEGIGASCYHDRSKKKIFYSSTRSIWLYPQVFLCLQGTRHSRIKHKQSKSLCCLDDAKYGTGYEPVKSMTYLSVSLNHRSVFFAA